jgi:hypothetical protein
MVQEQSLGEHNKTKELHLNFLNLFFIERNQRPQLDKLEIRKKQSGITSLPRSKRLISLKVGLRCHAVKRHGWLMLLKRWHPREQHKEMQLKWKAILK